MGEANMIKAVCGACGAEASISPQGIVWQAGARDRCIALVGDPFPDHGELAECPWMAEALKAATMRAGTGAAAAAVDRPVS
jgi:hypothetical protein